MELRVCSACRQSRGGHTACPGCGGTLALGDERLLLGETFGKYQLEAVLGAGGMGIVYRARHVTLRRTAALKVLVPSSDREPVPRRFLREAQILAELKHPHIVDVYDFDVSTWGLPYYVMELLPGASVGALVSGRSAPLPPAAVSAILGPVAEALDWAHRTGVVHRDLKPDNLFVAEFDRRAIVKVLDFGIAKMVGRDTEVSALTATGAVVGTPAYLTPEQLLGLPITPATDQYALALVAAELLAGRAMRAGRTLGEIIREDIRHPIAPERLPGALPAEARSALERATAPEPAARFPDVRSFVAALGLPAPSPEMLLAALDTRATPAPTLEVATVGETRAHDATATVLPTRAGTPPVPAPPTTAERPRASRRTRVLVAGAVAVGLALAVATAATWRRPRIAGPTAAPAGVPSSGVLRARRVIDVPADVTVVLARAEDALVLQGAGAFYLLPLKDGSAPTRVPLAVGRSLVGASADGELWVREGDGVQGVDPVSGRAEPLATGLSAPAPSDARPAPVLVSPSGGTLAVVSGSRILVGSPDGGRFRPRFTLTCAPEGALRAVLGDRWLVVWESGRGLTAWRVEDGTRGFSAPFGEMRVSSLALLDDGDQVALGGWFDHVDVFELREGGAHRSLPHRGQESALAWVPDGPTLLIGGSDGLTAWRAGSSAPVGAQPGPSGSALYAGSVVASLDPVRNRLSLLDYGALPLRDRVSLGHGEVWALTAAPGMPGVVAGTRDGQLHAWQPGQPPRSLSLHSDGVTDLVADGAHLASSSDDKTIGIWKTPSLAVEWRTQAHDFLVNGMMLRGDPASLWSASSDGTVKRWDWPQPQPRETLDTRTLLGGRRHALQTVWVSADGKQVAAGTWEHALVLFQRTPAGWKAREVPVASQAVYRMVELAPLGVVLLVGLQPEGVYLLDPTAGTVARLRSFGADTYAAVAVAGGREAIALGSGIALRYAFERGPSGLRYRVAAQAGTELPLPLSAAVTEGGLLVMGTADGQLLTLDPAALVAKPLVADLPVR